MKKYKLTKNKINIGNDTMLYQIVALTSFSDIEKGDLGGWVESEKNLSQKGNSWIYPDAAVYDSAKVYDNAKVYDSAVIHGNAKIYEDASVFQEANVLDNAEVFGHSIVSGNSTICSYAKIYGKARVYGHAKISGKARIYGNSYVSGIAVISGYSKICDNYYIVRGYVSRSLRNISYNLAAQLGVVPDNKGNVKLYKRVNKINNKQFRSLYDKSFIYEIGKIVSVKKCNNSNSPCSEGIHLSTPLYWNKGNSLIECEVNIKDIVSIQAGKVRCKKCKVIREVRF